MQDHMNATLSNLLLQSARLSVDIRKEYERVKRDQNARFYTYVLQLQDGKFYVGNTDNVYARLLDHKLMSPSSALWVRQHGPVARVLEIACNSGKEDEHYKTVQYMSMFGWENVRGSSYCKVVMPNPPVALRTFQRTRDGEFSYMTREEIDEVMAIVQELEQQANA